LTDAGPTPDTKSTSPRDNVISDTPDFIKMGSTSNPFLEKKFQFSAAWTTRLLTPSAPKAIRILVLCCVSIGTTATVKTNTIPKIDEAIINIFLLSRSPQVP
jgi:hypothetical protein